MTVGEQVAKQWLEMKDWNGSDLPMLDSLIDYAIDDIAIAFTDWLNLNYQRVGSLWAKPSMSKAGKLEYHKTEALYQLFKEQKNLA